MKQNDELLPEYINVYPNDWFDTDFTALNGARYARCPVGYKVSPIKNTPSDTATQYNPADYGDKSSGLQFEIEHLKSCIKYDKWLESEVMEVGSKYLKVRDGQTYSSIDCWEAIKKQLDPYSPSGENGATVKDSLTVQKEEVL